MPLHPLHAPVADLLRRVGQDVLLRHFRQLADHHITEKSPGELVTIADHESEALLEAGLAPLLPDASIVGEEAAAADPGVLDRLQHDQAWIIDPIDGTHNFAHGTAPFGMLIALAQGGETEAGWIYDPLRDRLCHAWRGHGAYVGDEPVGARPTGETPPVGAISTLFVTEPRASLLRARAEARYRLVDIPRCAAEQYPRLVLGENDVTLYERTLPWDHAAGALFLEEAGGRARRTDGSPYRPGDARTGMIAAASPALWDAAAAQLGDLVGS